MNSDYVEFWKKVKLINKDIKRLPISINNVSSEKKISEIFKEKNCELLTSVSYKESEMLDHQALQDRNFCKICTSGNCYSDHKINIHDVKKAITFLKKGKTDGNCEMASEHLIYGSNQLYVHISMLFQSMLTHGFSPNVFLESIIVPIPKSKRKSLSDIKNYRGISSSSMLGKVMDNIIVSLHSDVLHTEIWL